MRILTSAAAIAALAVLSACGQSTPEQAIIGAGAGTATAVVLNGNPVAGAVIGAGANVAYCQTNPGKC